MIASTIAQVKQMEDKQIVYRIDGTLKAIWALKDGAKDDGTPWTRQSFILAQGADELTVTAWDHKELPVNLKGQTVSICAFKGAKGWSGVKVRDGKDKEGNARKELSLTKAAEIVVGGLNDAGTAEQDEIPMGNAPTPQKAISDPAKASPAINLHDATYCWALGQSILTMNALGVDWFTEDKQLWERASKLVHAVDALRSGKLAPHTGHKKASPAPEPEATKGGDDVGF